MLSTILFIVFMGIGVYSLISVFSLVTTFIKLNKFDELQRNAVYESLAISFLIIAGIHFLQLMISVVTPDPFSMAIKFWISPGAYKGALMTNSPLHFDSFMIDAFVLAIVYNIKRRKYGLI